MKKLSAEEVEAKEVAGIAMKTLKSSSEVENFYRFIHDNGLREEAKVLMGLVLESIAPKSKRGRKAKTLQ